MKSFRWLDGEKGEGQRQHRCVADVPVTMITASSPGTRHYFLLRASAAFFRRNSWKTTSCSTLKDDSKSRPWQFNMNSLPCLNAATGASSISLAISMALSTRRSPGTTSLTRPMRCASDPSMRLEEVFSGRLFAREIVRLLDHEKERGYLVLLPCVEELSSEECDD